MNRNELYFHFANLGLVLIGILSVQSILNPFVVIIVIPGTIAGFIFSWQASNSKFQHLDTFIGMLSLAATVIVLGRLYDTAITFHSLLKIFSTALVWLTLFQSLGLKTGKSYAMLQFISVCLFISSIGLALEQEMFYLILLAPFLFIFIFTMRLSLVCDRKRKGSTIVGDQEQVMSLWQQIKIGALMFIFIFAVAGLVYPLVPRFENLSLRWIPSTLLGIPEKIPILKLFKHAPTTIKDNKRIKKEQLIDDGTKKRETAKKLKRKEEDKNQQKKRKTETTKRFRAKGFNKNIDIFKIESLRIRSDKEDVRRDSQCQLHADLKMTDGSVLPVTQLVDWKVSGTASVTMDSKGILTPKEEGYVTVTASYLGTFSNDVHIKVTAPLKPIKKKSWLYYLWIFLLWFLVILSSTLLLWIFIRSRRLTELAIKNPKEFIKEVYAALCRAFKPYGVRRFDYFSHREFSQSLKGLIGSKSEPMCSMTEGVLEARFSTHDISVTHSKKILGLFHEVKDVVLERDERSEFFKKMMFKLFLLEVSMVPRDIRI